MLKESVYDFSQDDYLIPVGYVDSTNRENYGTNLIKFKDQDGKVPSEFYYMDEKKVSLPDAVKSFRDANANLKASEPFIHFWSVNVDEPEINSFYFSYNTKLTEKLAGITYEIEQDLMNIAYLSHIRVDATAAFVCVYYGIDSSLLGDFLSKVSATEDEKSKMNTVLGRYKEITHFTYARKNGVIKLYVRGDLA